MSSKESLKTAWDLFRTEHKMLEHICKDLNIADDSKKKLVYYDKNIDTIFSFENAYSTWKNFLKALDDCPDNPKLAVDNFALFWDSNLLVLLRTDDKNLVTNTENYLYSRFNKLTYKNINSNEALIRVAFNDAFSKCIKKWKENDFNAKMGLLPYFEKALENAFIDAVKKEMRHTYVALESLSEESLNLIEDSFVRQLEDQDFLLACIRKLSPECQLILTYMSENDGYDLEGIQEALQEPNLTLDAVKQKVSRCRAKLRDHYWNHNNRKL